MKKRQKRLALLRENCFNKALKIMKLTAAFLLICCLSVSAAGHSQTKITLKFENTDIQQVMAAIEKKTNYRFLYSQQVIRSIDKVSVDAIEEDVAEIVGRMLKGTKVS